MAKESLGSVDDFQIAQRRKTPVIENTDSSLTQAAEKIANSVKSVEEREAEKEQTFIEANSARKRLRQLKEKQKKSRLVVLNVWFTPEQKARLKKWSDKTDISQSKLCETATIAFLDDLEA